MRQLVDAVRSRADQRRDEEGTISILILGLSIITIMVIVVGIGITAVQLERMRLLDAADAAALSAANALDESAYNGGVGESVPISNASVQEAAGSYLASTPVPNGVNTWWVAPGTGTPDGRTAVVSIGGDARIPLVGSVLSSVGGSITLTVTSRARADLVP